MKLLIKKGLFATLVLIFTSQLALAVDVLATGLGPGALAGSRETYARMVDADLHVM